jgi:hypothetical protein
MVAGMTPGDDTCQTFWQRTQRTERPVAPIAMAAIW